MNIIAKITWGDVSYLNGKIEIPNKKLADTTIPLLMNYSNKKELWYLLYQYVILI